MQEARVKRTIKLLLSRVLAAVLAITRGLREDLSRIYAHAQLASSLHEQLPASVVVLGNASIFGTRNIRIGENVLLYPALHLETQGTARINIGDEVVISRGVHIVAMAGVTIGHGSLIGEYTSIRDANHTRDDARGIRYSSHSAKPINIGSEVWIGRGVTVLAGVTIGDKATVGANAVVTHDVDAGEVVAGVPAASIRARSR